MQRSPRSPPCEKQANPRYFSLPTIRVADRETPRAPKRGPACHPPCWIRDYMRIRGYHPAHPHLFSVREVAGATGFSPKVIRAAEAQGMTKSERLAGEKARKLFFPLAEVRRFLNQYAFHQSNDPAESPQDCPFFPDGFSQALQSPKIALNPHFVRGNAVPIEVAQALIGVTRRRMRHYLDRGALKKISCGHRTLLITVKSVGRLAEKII